MSFYADLIEIIISNNKNTEELSLIVDKYLIPNNYEKNINAEVSTPIELRNKMLDKIPKNFWTSKKKVFEPCCGKGGFVIDIINRFMKGLKKSIPNEEQRYKTIIEDCLYFSDINKENVELCKFLIDPYDDYKLNYNEGNTLNLNIKNKWNVDGFDAVISNPPYNSSTGINTGNTIYQHFIKISLNTFLKKDGFLLFINPPLWRKPYSKRGKFYGLFELMTKKNQMLFLSINGKEEGTKIFKCGTRFDWYLIQKTLKYKKSIVIDGQGIKNYIDMNQWKWLPNYNIKKIKHFLAKDDKEKCNILCDFSYSRLDKKIVSKIKTDIFKYPLIYLTPAKGIRYMYSSINTKGHFNIPKIIIGETGVENALNDYRGEYGMTQDSFGIIIKDKKEGDNILNAIKSKKFINLIKSNCAWSNFRIDYRLFKDFNKDFWKEFI